MREVRFDHIGVFTYSHEEGTTAHDLADDVPARVKQKRRNALMAEQKRIVGRAQRRRVGAQVEVMVDGPSPEHELVWRGRLAGQAPDIDPVVYFTDTDVESLRPGAVFPAEIVGSREYDLVVRALVINFQVRKSLQDLKWAGAHFLFLRVVLRSSLTEFAPSPSGWPAPITWRFSTSSSGASPAGWMLRIFVDVPFADADAALKDEEARRARADASPTIQDLEQVSRESARFWTSKRPIDQSYTLEVSSPGLDRPLRSAADYRRFTGRLAKIVVSRAGGRPEALRRAAGRVRERLDRD